MMNHEVMLAVAIIVIIALFIVLCYKIHKHKLLINEKLLENQIQLKFAKSNIISYDEDSKQSFISEIKSYEAINDTVKKIEEKVKALPFPIVPEFNSKESVEGIIGKLAALIDKNNPAFTELEEFIISIFPSEQIEKFSSYALETIPKGETSNFQYANNVEENNNNTVRNNLRKFGDYLLSDPIMLGILGTKAFKSILKTACSSQQTTMLDIKSIASGLEITPNGWFAVTSSGEWFTNTPKVETANLYDEGFINADEGISDNGEVGDGGSGSLEEFFTRIIIKKTIRIARNKIKKHFLNKKILSYAKEFTEQMRSFAIDKQKEFNDDLPDIPLFANSQPEIIEILQNLANSLKKDLQDYKELIESLKKLEFASEFINNNIIEDFKSQLEEIEKQIPSENEMNNNPIQSLYKIIDCQFPQNKKFHKNLSSSCQNLKELIRNHYAMVLTWSINTNALYRKSIKDICSELNNQNEIFIKRYNLARCQ